MKFEEILTKHVKEDGTFDVQSAVKEINEQLPKSFVPKHTFNEQSDKLKAAESTIEQLQAGNKENEALQKEVEGYKTQIAELEAQGLARMAEFALREAGATDIEFGLYKLGALESDGNGGVKDLANKIKEFKESSPKYFAEEVDPLKDYTKVDSTLKDGAQATQSDTEAMIAAMTSDIMK